MSPQSQLDLTGTSSGIFLFKGFFYEGLFSLGILWGLVGSGIGLLTGIEYSALEWLVLSLLVGLVIQFAVFGLKKIRFHNPVTNNSLLSLFEMVKADIGTGEDVQLWFRDVDRSVFLSTTNLFFKAILLSESTIGDLLKNPERGKIVLAWEVLMMKRIHPISGLALGTLIFAFFSFAEGASFTSSMFSFFSFDFLPLFLILMFVGAIALMALIPIITAKSTHKIDKFLEELYGSLPEVVTAEVLTGYRIPDELIDEVKRDEAEGKPSAVKKALKRSLLAVAITIPASFVIQILLLPRMLTFIIFPLMLSVVIGFMVFVIVSMLGPMLSMFRGPGKRKTDWDIRHPLADGIQQFLSKNPRYQNISVKAVKPHSDELPGLVIEKLMPDYSEEVVFGMAPQMLEDIQDVDLAGPYILSELQRKDIEKRYNRLSYLMIAVAIAIMVIGFLWMFADFMTRMQTMFIPLMGVYMLIAIIPGIFLSVWKRRAETRSDVEIAQKCPRLMDALQSLIDGHHTQRYGITSYRTRLDRIKENLSQLSE